ncbi:LysE family translocator [Elusimicrobiota bacterium]
MFMHIGLLIMLSFTLGFITSIPIGACQIEVAKRSLHNHLLSAFMVILGACAADIVYGIIALFGLTPFLRDKMTIAIFELACVVVLLTLAFFTLKQSAKPHITHMEVIILKSKRVGFVTGFLLALANPLMIFWWLVGANIIRDLGIIKMFNTTYSVIFISSAVLGLMTYLTTLAFILNWAHKFISHKTIQRVNFGLGTILVGLSIYFLISSLKVLLGY